VNYYRRFVKGFDEIAGPLHKLTKKRAKKNFRRENEYDETLKELKRMLCSAPILALLSFENNAPPFVLDTDTSDSRGRYAIPTGRRRQRTRHRIRQYQTQQKDETEKRNGT
ncbi:Retrovirus-related Pol polyprotein from transposon, partial [Taenia solium]